MHSNLQAHTEHPTSPLLLLHVQASTASSGSPHQHEQQQQRASPVRLFPGLGGSGTPRQAMAEQVHQQAASQVHAPAPGQHPAQQPQQAQQAQQPGGPAPSASASASRLAAAGSASSIGRKRSNSEVGVIEQPASVKKHSPEVGGRLLSRTACELGSSGAAAAAALEAAALEAPGMLAPVVEHGGEVLQQPQPEWQHPFAQPSTPMERPNPALPPTAVRAVAASSNHVVLPVVMQRSPGQERRHVQPSQSQVSAAAPQPAAASEQEAPAAPAAQPQQRAQDVGKQEQAFQQPTSQPPQRQQQQQQPELQRQQRGEQAPEAQTLRQRGEQQPEAQQQQQRGEQRPPGVTRLPVAAAASAAAAMAAEEKELPSHSSWVASPGEQQQQQHTQPSPQQPPQQLLQQSEGQPELHSHSVLLTSHGTTAAPAVAAAALTPASRSSTAIPPDCTPLHCHTSLPASALAAAAAAVAAAAGAPIITPRRRIASLEPPEAGPCLRHDPHGALPCCCRYSRVSLLASRMKNPALPASKLCKLQHPIPPHPTPAHGACRSGPAEVCPRADGPAGRGPVRRHARGEADGWGKQRCLSVALWF